jgi:hypothetical protein
MSDFKEWWNKAEIFCGEGGMEAAEAAWDYQQEKIESMTANLEELEDTIVEWDEIFSDMPCDPREV